MLLATENECNQSKKRGKFSASWLFLFCQAWKTIIMNLTHGRCAHSRIAGFGCDFHYDIDQNHPYAGIFIPFSSSSRRLSIRSIVPFSFVYALWLSHFHICCCHPMMFRSRISHQTQNDLWGGGGRWCGAVHIIRSKAEHWWLVDGDTKPSSMSPSQRNKKKIVNEKYPSESNLAVD